MFLVERKTLFYFSFLSMGLISVILMISNNIYKKNNLKDINEEFSIQLVWFFHIGFAFWTFAFHASYCAKKRGLYIMGFLYIISTLMTLIGAILIWSSRIQFNIKFEETWNKLNHNYSDWTQLIQTNFDCSGYNISLNNKLNCKVVMENYFNKMTNIIGGILILFTILLTLGSIFSFVIAPTKIEKKEDLNYLKN